MHNYILEELLDDLLTGRITPEDAQKFVAAIDQPDLKSEIESILEARFLNDKYEIPVNSDRKALLKQKLLTEISPPLQPIVLYKKKPFIQIARWAAAAAMLFCIVGLAYFFNQKKITSPNAIANTTDIAPGHNGALLTLANGNKIMLDTAKDGLITVQNGIKIIKQNGMIKYEGATTEPVYNTASTDRGRQYQITLADGTKVWLNAESSIRYPLAFNGKERIVEITGEAYFEVVHNAKQPFKVKTSNQIIQDIGTGFNVNAYPDEASINTTLLEGAINVSVNNKNQLLTPGQQAQVNVTTADIKLVKNVDVEQAVAWKNGAFSFTDANLSTVMRQMARWYNVEVKYTGAVPEKEFSGEIGRDLTLDQVLKILTKNKVKYQIEGKQITITP